MSTRTKRNLGVCALALLVSVASARSAAADPSAERDIVVLRRDAGGGQGEARVGRALVAELGARQGVAHAEASSTTMSQLALAAGCDRGAPDCGARIARAVSATVVVWDVEPGSDGTRLTLTAFEPVPSAEGGPSTVSVTGDGERAVEGAVSELMDELGTEAATPPDRAPSHVPWRDVESRGTHPPVPAVFATLGLGTGAVATGVSLAVVARRGDAASGGRDRRQARGGYAMLSIGSALLAVGGTLLAVQLTEDDESPLAGGVSVRGDAAMAWLRGPIGP